MLERIDTWKGEIKGTTYEFFIEKLVDDQVEINCCYDEPNGNVQCLTYPVQAGMSRNEVQAYFENDPTFLMTFGRDD